MIYYNDVIFSKQECVDILNSTNEYIQSVVGINYNNELYDMVANTNKRKSTQAEMSAKQDTFIYKRINEIVNTFNYKLVCDELNYDIIKYKESDFVWKHRDENGERMFTIVVQLNEDNSYTGGEFVYWLDGVEYQMDKNIGMGIAFKASVFHEVKAVIIGERHSFVSFIKFTDIEKIGGKGLI